MKNEPDQVVIPRRRYKIYVAAITIATFFFIIGITYVVYLKSSNTPESFDNPFPLIDISRNFIEQEHFITNIQPLRESLNQIVKDSKPNDIGIYFEMLNTGANISINQDVRFIPASLSKMPTALAVMKNIEMGRWKYGNELVLFEEDKEIGFGTLYKKPTGTRIAIEDLLKKLLIESDDTAHRIFFRNLGDERYEEIRAGLGMEELYDKDYYITAKEYSRIFRTLYTSSFLKREYSSQLLSWLSETPFDSYLGSAVPKEIVFSHKFGEHRPERTYLDSGIVYVPDRPYLITVMVRVNVDSEDEGVVEEIMRKISYEAYDYVSNY